MRSIQKVTRVQLKIDKDDELNLFGIVSAEPDYKLSLALNKKLGISLRNVLPVKFIDDKGSEQVFSRFSDLSSAPEVLFNLISNRSGKNFLLKKLKNIDYLFQISDPENNSNIGQMSSILKEIDNITAVFSIDPKAIKDKNLQYLTQ